MEMYRDKPITIKVNDVNGCTKRLVVKENTLWVAQSLRRLTRQAIPDRYLKNIIRFVLRGGGFIEFLQIKDVVRNLANEAYNRCLISTAVRNDLYKMGIAYEKAAGARYTKFVNIYDLKGAADLLESKMIK